MSYSALQASSEQAHKNSRTIGQFAFEMSIPLLACISGSKRLPVSMLADLRSALYSSGKRREFICSFGFLALLLGYFSLLPLLQHGLDIPNDIIVMSLQFLSVAVLFLLVLSSGPNIAEVLDASSVCHAILVMTTPPVVEDFRDFLPTILTPPPNLQAVF